MSFKVAIINVSLAVAFIIPGFIISKLKRAKVEHLSTLSAVLVYICSPCMIINSFLSIEFSWQQFGMMALFFGVTLVLQAVFMLVLFLILRKRYEDGKYRMITIGSVLGNVGFFGLPIVKALLPENPEVMCYSSVFVISMNLIVFTVGVFCLTGDKKTITLKSALLNPATFGIAVALPLYFFGAREVLPSAVLSSINITGSVTTPLCMIILGIRLANVSLKKLFTRPVVYIICACKLIIFPLFCYLAVYFLPIDYSFKASILILSATPCASIIFNIAEMHNSQEELSANCVLLSTILCCLTIPVLSLLL